MILTLISLQTAVIEVIVLRMTEVLPRFHYEYVKSKEHYNNAKSNSPLMTKVTCKDTSTSSHTHHARGWTTYCDRLEFSASAV